MNEEKEYYLSPALRIIGSETSYLICTSYRTYTNEVETSGQNIVETDNDAWDGAWE